MLHRACATSSTTSWTSCVAARPKREGKIPTPSPPDGDAASEPAPEPDGDGDGDGDGSDDHDPEGDGRDEADASGSGGRAAAADPRPEARRSERRRWLRFARPPRWSLARDRAGGAHHPGADRALRVRHRDLDRRAVVPERRVLGRVLDANLRAGRTVRVRARAGAHRPARQPVACRPPDAAADPRGRDGAQPVRAAQRGGRGRGGPAHRWRPSLEPSRRPALGARRLERRRHPRPQPDRDVGARRPGRPLRPRRGGLAGHGVGDRAALAEPRAVLGDGLGDRPDLRPRHLLLPVRAAVPPSRAGAVQRPGPHGAAPRVRALPGRGDARVRRSSRRGSGCTWRSSAGSSCCPSRSATSSTSSSWSTAPEPASRRAPSTSSASASPTRTPSSSHTTC